MSIALVVTRGFGNGTLTGTIADVVTRGYTIGEAIVDAVITNADTLTGRQASLAATGRQDGLTLTGRQSATAVTGKV